MSFFDKTNGRISCTKTFGDRFGGLYSMKYFDLVIKEFSWK